MIFDSNIEITTNRDAVPNKIIASIICLYSHLPDIDIRIPFGFNASNVGVGTT